MSRKRKSPQNGCHSYQSPCASSRFVSTDATLPNQISVLQEVPRRMEGPPLKVGFVTYPSIALIVVLLAAPARVHSVWKHADYNVLNVKEDFPSGEGEGFWIKPFDEARENVWSTNLGSNEGSFEITDEKEHPVRGQILMNTKTETLSRLVVTKWLIPPEVTLSSQEMDSHYLKYANFSRGTGGKSTSSSTSAFEEILIILNGPVTLNYGTKMKNITNILHPEMRFYRGFPEFMKKSTLHTGGSVYFPLRAPAFVLSSAEHDTSVPESGNSNLFARVLGNALSNTRHEKMEESMTLMSLISVRFVVDNHQKKDGCHELVSTRARKFIDSLTDQVVVNAETPSVPHPEAESFVSKRIFQTRTTTLKRLQFHINLYSIGSSLSPHADEGYDGLVFTLGGVQELLTEKSHTKLGQSVFLSPMNAIHGFRSICCQNTSGTIHWTIEFERGFGGGFLCDEI